MDIRKESISSQKLCRFCLNQNDSLSSLYDRIKAPKDAVPLSLKILSCVGIEVFPSDKMPQYICHHCKFFMDLSYRFKQICRQGDENILQFIQNEKPITAVPWPAALKKVYKAIMPSQIKSNEVGLVETVTQSGDTVQVMAEEMSDSEEGEDDSVYNVKVPDGPEEGKRIKVVTTDKNNGKKRSRKDSEEESAVLPVRPVLPIRPVRPSPVDDGGCWPCDECDCTYPLEQLLSLHKSQKHRTRNIACVECGAKFFSKYDLITHQLTHSPEMPFQCVACGKKFKRLILLKRHERLMHAELPQQVCPHCPATFLSIEELDAHKQRHNIHLEKRHICLICDKRFNDKSTLHKHIEGVHNKKSMFTCQYCNERFSSVTKLTRHLRAHAGERPYPCKHCDKSFIKSHHYTRHLRVKHSDHQDGVFDSEPYRCEECEESFSTQDDLMYHSALHATQNLVCPLCQEKFDDVDNVTAHIKSHVNGKQFMCDFCELIFTSKEKLENHLARAHDDELMANEQELDQDETSMEMDEEEDDDNSINLKEEGDHMVVEIKKANEYMLPTQEEEHKNDNTQSEDSEVDATYDDSKQDSIEKALAEALPAVEVTKIDTSTTKIKELEAKLKISPAVVMAAPAKITDAGGKQTPPILKKAEEIKRKGFEQSSGTSIEKSIEKKSNNNNKVESSTSTTGPSEKSLRLLEKELQDLKRTSRNEAAKTPQTKTTLESLRKRQVIHTSTPKTSRNVDKKELQSIRATVDKTAPSERRTIERRSTPKEPKDTVKDKEVTKDSKESTTKESANKDSNHKESVVKDSKETKEAVIKESKETKESKELKDSKEAKSNVKDIKEESGKEEVSKSDKKESKDKENTKAVVKNGVSEKAPEEAVRRSTRPSKVKDYAKMIRDDQSTTSDDTDAEQNEDTQGAKPADVSTRGRGRKSISKPPPTPPKTNVAPPTPASLPKKRGRPRKVQTPITPAKVRKTESSEQTDKSEIIEQNETPITETLASQDEPNPDTPTEENTEDATKAAQSKLMVSPTGQTLKKVPIKALPPGVKPMPLPRTMGAGEVCEMQIGKKVVKVQKIVMTKAEVEAMAKKGLVEMKDGTMVLKQGIKLPDAASLKSTLVNEGDKQQEFPKKE